ncbi:MAG: hypothetical protein LUI07_00585, partial [Lachnospiraceae bacterium]|nr:hypothetical protein [Lachnospiraceae bacterium]
MRIEKRYYSEESEMWRRIEQQEEARKEAAPDDLRDAEAMRLEREAAELEERVKSMQVGRYQVIRKERLERFQTLTEKALTLAEAAPMDIVVDTEHFSGQIRMTADCLIIMASSPADMRTNLAALIKEAESVSVFPKEDGLIEISFAYPFCSEISGTEGYI